MSEDTKSSTGFKNVLLGILLLVGFYTCLGMTSAGFYNLGAAGVGLAVVGYGPFLALWWAAAVALSGPMMVWLFLSRASQISARPHETFEVQGQYGQDD